MGERTFLYQNNQHHPLAEKFRDLDFLKPSLTTPSDTLALQKCNDTALCISILWRKHPQKYGRLGNGLTMSSMALKSELKR